jgi:hypothetical protein
MAAIDDDRGEGEAVQGGSERGALGNETDAPEVRSERAA